MPPIAISMVARSHRIPVGRAPARGHLRGPSAHCVYAVLRQVTERVIDGLEDSLDRARAIYDYLTQHIDYRYQPPYRFWLHRRWHTRSAAIAALWRSRLSPCAVSRACLLVLYSRFGGTARLAEFFTPQTGWLNADVSFGSSSAEWGGVASSSLLWQSRPVAYGG